MKCLSSCSDVLCLRLIHQSTDRGEHAIPLFIESDILPIIFLYVDQVISNLMYDMKKQFSQYSLSILKSVLDVQSYNTIQYCFQGSERGYGKIFPAC